MADHSIWLKSALIPFWGVQLLFSAILLAAAIIALIASYNIADNADLTNGANGLHLVNVSAAVLIAFTVLTILFDISEIIMFSRQRLHPVTHLVLQCFKSLFWTFYFASAIAAIVEDGAGGLSVLLALLLFCASLGQLIYGAVIVHRHRKGTLYRGQYAPAATGAYNMGYNAPPFEHSSNAYEGGGGAPGAPNPFGDPAPTPLAGTAYKPYQPYQPYPGGQPAYELNSHMGAGNP